MIDWLQQGWGYIAALSVTLATILSLNKSIKEIKEKLNEPNEKQNRRIEALEKQMVEAHESNITKFTMLGQAMACLLRDRINELFIQANGNGFISQNELEIIEKMYESYSALGGNGVIAREMAIIRQLPIK